MFLELLIQFTNSSILFSENNNIFSANGRTRCAGKSTPTTFKQSIDLFHKEERLLNIEYYKCDSSSSLTIRK